MYPGYSGCEDQFLVVISTSYDISRTGLLNLRYTASLYPSPNLRQVVRMVSPLCDKDLTTMSPVELVSADIRLLHAYHCDRIGCHRCYHVVNGYFDYIAGRLYVSERQLRLCEIDARAMYLDAIRGDGEQTWRCPECGGIEQH